MLAGNKQISWKGESQSGQHWNPWFQRKEDYDFLKAQCGNPRKLSSEEVEDLPVIISWRGDKCSFETDEKECIELLASIISDMNSMQDDFISFPLGMYISCLYANETNKYGISYSEGQSHQISCTLMWLSLDIKRMLAGCF